MLAACWSCGTCSNFTSSASSVYQPGLRWPPRILTVNFQVIRGHDGHSGVRRPVWSSHKTHEEKLCQIRQDQRGFNIDLVCLFVFFVCFSFNLCTYSTLPEPELDNQLSVWTSVHSESSARFDSNKSQCHNYGNTESEFLYLTRRHDRRCWRWSTSTSLLCNQSGL